ncbi:iron-containing redox enzyme family protein [Microbacterium sp. K2]|uniref:iron-containing redox enzyme family protein n=1 Tax=Microbacterium sp. K2 TaxID=3391827 RepID=UPI003EDACADD
MSAPALIPSALHGIAARGPLSDGIIRRLTGDDVDDLGARAESALAMSDDVVRDDDIQLALFVLYASSYGSLPGLDPALEWDPALIATRGILEHAFERALRATVPTPELPEPTVDAVGRALFALAEADTGPSLSRYVAKKATEEQMHEFFMQRSIYTLREADPHSWAIPRLAGRPKAALVEIQSDEYGGGRPDRVHATIFARAMRGAGLDDTYGAYVDDVPAITLASLNSMSMFGLNRRLLGAIVGHLAAFEMTSSIPNRFYADGLRRLGFTEDVTDYFDEHVEADAVHEQIAARDLAGGLAEDRPDLLPDIMFGAAACLTVDGWAAGHMLDSWTRGESSLRERDAR